MFAISRKVQFNFLVRFKDYRIKKQDKKLKGRHGEYWTIEEEKLIYDRFVNGVNAQDVALELNRTKGSIRSRWRKIGLLDRNSKPIVPVPPFTPYAKESRRFDPPKERAVVVFEEGAEQATLNSDIDKDPKLSPKYLRENELISRRLVNSLIKMGVQDIREIFHFSDRDMLRQPNLGRKTLNEWKALKANPIFDDINALPDIEEEHSYDDIEGLELKSEEDANLLLDYLYEEISILEKKSSRLAHILKLRFGFDENEDQPLTLQKIADQYSLSRERIRQLENKASRRLSYTLRTANSYSAKYIKKSLLTSFADETTALDDIVSFCFSYYDIDMQNAISSLLCVSYGLFPDYKSAAPKLSKALKLFRREYKRKARKEERQQAFDKAIEEKWHTIYAQVIWPKELKYYDGIVQGFEHSKREINEESIGRTGVLDSEKCQREVHFESQEEFLIYQVLEHEPKVKWYQEQPCEIPYQTNADYIYYPDVATVTQDRKAFVIEVKPIFNMLRKPVIIKALAAINHLHEMGVGYAMLDRKGRSVKSHAQKPYSKELAEYILSEIDTNGFVRYERIKERDDVLLSQLPTILINYDLQYSWGKIERLPPELSYEKLK